MNNTGHMETAMNPMQIPNPQRWGTPQAMPTSPTPTDTIRDLAFQAFGTDRAVDFWMKHPNPELGGPSPQELIDNGHGDKVKEFLESLLAGDFG
jgi:hypothetical protein